MILVVENNNKWNDYINMLEELKNYIEENKDIIDRIDSTKLFNYTSTKLKDFLEKIYFNQLETFSNSSISILHRRIVKENCKLILMNEEQYEFNLRCRNKNVKINGYYYYVK